MGAPRVTPKVAEYFLGHPNKPLSLTQICDACGFNKTQTQASIYRLLREEKLPGAGVLGPGVALAVRTVRSPSGRAGVDPGGNGGRWRAYVVLRSRPSRKQPARAL